MNRDMKAESFEQGTKGDTDENSSMSPNKVTDDANLTGSDGAPSDTQSDPIWSILPSYGMYTSIYKPVDAPRDDDLNDPPIYEHSLLSSNTSGGSSHESNGETLSLSFRSNRSSNLTLVSDAENHTSQNLILADQDSNMWRETILDNAHKLRNTSDSKNGISESLKIQIKFTRDVGKPGVKPVVIDPTLHEYKQGDLINGIVLIENLSDTPIPFDMFYVVFEGSFMVANTRNIVDKRPIHFRKFLEMFDFSASWNEAQVNRLFDENYDPYSCPLNRDTLDGSYLGINHRVLRPKVLYKRFFTFRIPEKLLDSECSQHNLSGHVELPPTLGMSRYEAPLNSKTHMKDLSFLDASISYDVLARFIGRSSSFSEDISKINTTSMDTKLVNSSGDEYIIFKEARDFIRILQENKPVSENERSMKLTENKVIFDMFKKKLNEYVNIAKRLASSKRNNVPLDSVDSINRLNEAEAEVTKARQLYNKNSLVDQKQHAVQEMIEVLHPVSKNNFGLSSKAVGVYVMRTPRSIYQAKYISPSKFRSDDNDHPSPRILSIPITFIQTSANGNQKKIPSIKTIKGELFVLTLKSNKYSIPFEFNHDFFYNNEHFNNGELDIDQDTFTKNIKSHLRAKGSELAQYSRSIENFSIEKVFADDLKALCNMEERLIKLNVNDLQLYNNQRILNGNDISSANWAQDQSTGTKNLNLELKVNLDSCFMKAERSDVAKKPLYDRYCLVPSFQSCFMCRFYYVKFSIHLTNSDTFGIKVPLEIKK